MRKLLFATSAAILALSIVGCDSIPFLGGGGGEEEATPESSPSPTAQTPASPTPSPTPFASPDVPQTPPRTSRLTQSSNPDERVSQLEQQVGGQAPANAAQGRDPFSAVDISIPPPPESEDRTGGTPTDGPVVVTQLPQQRVPQIPSIPEIVSPPQLDGPQPPPLPGGGGDTRQPGQGGQGGTGQGGTPTARQPGTPTARQPGTPTARQPGTPTARQPGTPTAPSRDRTGGLIPDLAQGQVPELPKLGELTRPPQVGGTRLVGDVPPIRLSPVAEGVINEFRTFQALLDDTTTYSDYEKDLIIILEIFEPEIETRENRRNSVRRQLLQENRDLYRRLERVLQEYVFARTLWDTYYGQSGDPGTVRCSSIPVIERVISIYQVPTVQRGQLSCATRIAFLGSIWERAESILDAALRDRDFNAPSLADAPSLPDAGGPATVAQLPQLPEFEKPAVGTPSLPDAGGPATVGELPKIPEFEQPAEPLTGGKEPALPPPPPSTDLAKGVKVTGVVEVGNEKQVIIKAPGEATSRYVKVGQRVAGGKVLIKRVDFENGEAIVVLEENNIEVRKIVGEEPAVEE